MTAVEPLVDEQGGGGLDLFAADQRRLNALWKECAKIANSKLVPDDYKGDTETIYALARYGAPYGLAPIHSIHKLYVIAGKIVAAYDVLAGVMMNAGHEVMLEETSSTICTVGIRRHGTDYWQKVTYTIEDARRAGRLDMSVRRWVSASASSNKKYPEDYLVGYCDAGVDAELAAAAPDWAKTLIQQRKFTVNDAWAKHPDDMLAAAAIRRAAKRICPDALLNLPDPAGVEVEELKSREPVAARHEPERVVDGQLVDDEIDGGGAETSAEGSAEHRAPAADGASPTGEHDDDDGIEDAEIVGSDGSEGFAYSDETGPDAPVAGQEFTRGFAMRCRDTKTPDGRVLGDEDRHAIVRFATGGRIDSAKEVRVEEVSACYGALRDVERGQLLLVDIDGVRTARKAD